MKVIRFIFLSLSIALISWGCNNNDESAKAAQSNKIPVKTTPVKQEEIVTLIHTSGKLFSEAEMKLSFKIGGIIEEIFVDEGQQVHKGKLLAKLDQAEIEAQVNQAKNAFEKANRDRDRVYKLYEDSVATLEQLQDATTGLEIVKSNLIFYQVL